jgi:long-subunit acyl-CoA synthetase (AMP-forming)
MWKTTMEKYADLAALNYESKPGQWTTLTYRQYYQQALCFAKALISLGVK